VGAKGARYGIKSSSSANSISLETSSRSSLSFCGPADVSEDICVRQALRWAYMFRLELLLDDGFSLMEPAEPVDLVLILATHFGLVAPGSGFILF